jgi:hypothetical protein
MFLKKEAFCICSLKVIKMIKTATIENVKMDEGITDLVPCDQMYNRIESYLHEAPLNIEKGDYCYVKIVKNHLEIGRAKIVLEE